MAREPTTEAEEADAKAVEADAKAVEADDDVGAEANADTDAETDSKVKAADDSEADDSEADDSEADDSEADSDSEADAKVEAADDSDSKADSKVKADDTEAETDAKVKAADTKVKAKPDAKAPPQSKAKSDAKAIPQAKAKSRVKPEGGTKVKPGKSQAKLIVELEGVSKLYYRGREPVPVLDSIDLQVPEGSFEALMGPSGSGKTTLLNLIAGLDRPSKGTARVAGADLSSMDDGAMARFRARTIGFIFQTYNLLPVLTACENVELPLLLTKLTAAERRKRAQTALRVVGLENRMGHLPRQLSGGQEQRVAIARAIVNDPIIIVADEPTGDLDRKSAAEILDLLDKLNRDFKKTIFMVTHDPQAAERASIVRRLDKGTLQ